MELIHIDSVPPGHHYVQETEQFVGEGKNKRRVRQACKLWKDILSLGNDTKKVTNMIQ